MVGLQLFSTINSFFSPVDKYIIGPLKEHISYALDYTRNVAELRHKVETLGGARDNLQNSVHDAWRRGDEIQKNVGKWLADAEKAIEEAEKLIQSEEEAKKNRCFAGLCPNLKARHQLGKKAAEEASAIANLENEGKFDASQISYRPAPQQFVSSSVHGFEGLHSRASILEQVMDAVTDPNVNVVGVSGMGGVGKTTLVMEVHSKATEGKLFDVVALVTLSQKAELKGIQGDVAEVLGLKLEEQNLELRANRLKDRMKKEKKVLIILDNLWEEIDLGRLGIPLTEKQRVSSRGEDDQKTGEDDHKRCTILLTSRNRDLLTCKMGAQKEFPLDLLPEEESLSLLKRMVGDLKVQESLAIDVAKKCAGLPLLLATVAIGLKNKELEVWKDTLKRLSYFDDQQIQEKVHSVLELSYGDLAWEEARSFFLLCGLFPHADISILDLLKYSMGLGLLKRINTVQDARNRVHSLIGELKSSCLLLDSEKDGCVKIHDVVQDVATSIAFRDQLAFKKVSGPLEGDQSADVKCFKRIFLEVSDISEFRLWLQCPDIEFFRLSVQDRSVKIPDDLFEGITKLKVLNFTGMRFSSLPSSLSSVTSLHTLCLDGCRLQDISVIWQLKNLEVLSLRRSDIDELPRDLMQLTRLKMLDLTDCYCLEFIPEDVLSRLSLLEELHMGNSFTNWEVKRLDNKINASLSDLKQLSRLTYLEIDVPDASKLPKELFSKRLERFKISIGDGWDWRGRYQTSRTLKLKLHTSFHDWGQGVKIILEKAEDLYLDGLKGVKDVLYDIHEEGFPQLKHLLIQKGRDIQYIIDSKVQSTSKAFPVLESLILHKLVNLEKICQRQLMAGDFCQLKILRVKSCSKLKNLFPFFMIRNLKQLLEMEVMDCSDIEEIFTSETGEEEGDKNEVFEFTQLYSLKLQLPLLRRFCSKVKSSPASPSSANPRQNQSTIDPQSPLFDEMIVFPNLKDLKLSSIAVESIWWDQFGDQASFYNLTSLIVEACSKINSLFTSEMVIRNLGQLQRLEICECKSMEGVITAEGETICTTSFPKLEFLKLKGLSKLVRFFSGDFMELPSLKKLWIENCPALKSFASNPIANIISGANLALFNKKVAFPNLEELHIEDMNWLKMIWENEIQEGSFCKLKTMVVRGAKELVNVFPSNILMSRFMNLEYLDVTNCELIAEVFDLPPQEQLIYFSRLHGIPTSQLKKLKIQNLPNLKHIWKNDAREREIFFFQKLHDVNVCSCPSLKNIFPATIATHLSELEQLTIRSCGIEEIINRGEDTEASSRFEFPKLTTLGLYYLKEFKTLYPRTHIFDWPMLKKLYVLACPKMEIFSLESQSIGVKSWRSQSENPSRQPFFTVEKGFPNLEELTLDSKAAKSILNGNCSDNLFDKVRFLCLKSFDEESASFLFALLGIFGNLESLNVESNRLTELFSCEGLINEENQGRTIPRIKHMKLQFLHKLKLFCKQDCQPDRIFESIETLGVWWCDSLISLGPSINIASFGNLSRLDVWYCEGLLNLVTSSTAQCLGLLTELCIRRCSMVNEVVAREEDDREDQITWGNLKSLKLCNLSSLTYFCSAYHTFNFPSLEEVIIQQCPKIKAFSRGVSIAPMLKKVKLAEYNDKGHWAGDLNTTVQQLCAELVTFDGIWHLKLSEYPQLKEKWHSEELPAKFFSKLRSLFVDEGASSSTAIPSNLLPFLDNLTKLEVQNCDLVEEVFDLTLPNAADAPIGTLPELNELQLIDLPRLKYVWNEEPKGVFDFRNLEVIKIHNCPTLKYIFSPTTCLGLVGLQELEVKDCPLIEEIISKETTPCNVVFPLLSSIALECLPNLTSFYLGSSTVHCPSLEKIAAVDCSSAFTFTFLNKPPPNATNHASQAMIVFPNLKELQLSSNKMEEIWNSQHIDQSSCCQHLTTLIVEDCENLRYLFTSSMVEYLNQIKRLDICNCKSMEEVILRQEVSNGKSSRNILFPKVEVLKLEGLPKLTTFCTCSLFECPVLKKLQIDNCPQLKSLVFDLTSANLATSGQIDKCDSPLFDKKVAFPDVEELRIRNMYWLKTIWHDELHEDSFCKLRTLHVEQAEALWKVFPSTMLVRRFQNLEQLFIEECESLEEVFDIHGLMISIEETQVSTATSTLKILHIENLPKLKQVWNKDPRALLSFDNLNRVKIWKCPNLRSIFPASVARGLLQLEHLNIKRCGIEEIVEKEDGEETTATAFLFPKLIHLVLWRLPQLKRFYSGMHTSEWPALKELNVYHCDKMHTLEFQRFQEAEGEEEEVDGIQLEQSLFSFQEVIPNLERIGLTCKQATMICEGQFPEKLFHNLKSLRLDCFHDKLAVLPSGLLERFPNIRKLFLRCNQRRELFPCGLIVESEHARRPIPPIRRLQLRDVPNARHASDQDSQIDQLLQNLDVLELRMCDGLTNLTPLSTSFQSITSLDIFKCQALVHIFTWTTAKTLVQLRKLKIRNCTMVTEIVASTSHDSKHEIVFHELANLELHCLPSLTSFCSGEHSFKFPSLMKVIVSQCPRIEIFSKGVLRTPKLQSVKLTQQKDKECWNGNLNTTIQHLYKKMVGFHGLQELKLSNFPNLKEAWHNELPAECFYNLRSLVVEYCASFSNAVPSSLLSFLNRLKKLDVRNCDSLEEVFCPEGLGANPEHPVLSNLNEFMLSGLPRLRHIWNEGFCRVLGFKNLKLLKVHNCSSLKYIFTPTMALSLMLIQELEVNNCTSVEEIITSGEEETVLNTVFSQLNSLDLESLPNLTSFCSSTNVLELQSLEKVTVVDCPRIELFASTILGAQEPNVVVTNEGRLDQEGFSTPAVLLFGAKVTCRKLKELKVECNNNTKDMLDGKLPTEYSTKIEVLELTNFSHEETLFLFDILLRLPSLEKLVVNDADFGELLLEQRIVDKKNSDEQVTNLRQLKLSKLPKLSQLFQNHSIPDLVIQNLETLEVIECFGLKILMPSSLSFQNLATLEVSKCHGLSNLITCSTAKSLKKLTRMSISECDMLEEIVASEGKEGEDEIAFSQLKHLGLHCLPNLLGFCSGNHTFNFPSLEEVTLRECSKMRFFSEGVLFTPRLTDVQIAVDEDQWCWEGSLNTTVQQLFSEMGVGNA